MNSQLHDYQQNGYLIIENFICPHTCEALIARATQLIDNFNPQAVSTIFSTKDNRHARDDYFLQSGHDIRFFFEENAFNQSGELIVEKRKSINKIGHALHELDPIFKSFSQSPELSNLAAHLQLQDPLIIQSMYICKQPLIGGEVNCHQDGTYLHSANESITGFWIALEDATKENGCLWAIPGGHRKPLKARFDRLENNNTHYNVYDNSPWTLDQMVALEVPRGSIIVLHSRVPHMSYENKSHRSRHAYTLHVMDRHDTYLPTNWLRRPMSMPFQGFSD